jgi:acyl dehydratase
MAEATITPELIEEMRAKVGLALRIDHSINHEETTRLAVLRFADGIGDPNPLWRDPEYAATSPYGQVMAPPSWVISVFSGLQFGWPGLGSFHETTTIHLHRPVRLGDRIVPTCTYDGFDGPRPSKFANQVVVDRFTNHYRNQRDELIAELRWTVVNFERSTAREVGKESGITLPHPWTDDEVAAIEARVLAEEPRGAEVRFWEDVEVGDELDPVTKGPIGLTDEIAFVAAGGAPIPRLAAHGAALRAYEKHPAWAFRDPTTHALEPVYSVHYSLAAANAMGVPFQYDVGFQRQCWQMHLLSNWMGDHGWLKQVSAQYRRFVYLSDVVTLTGTVTSKFVDDDGEHCVEITTTSHNQRGDDVMPGRAIVVLPSRGHDTWPLATRV